MSLMKMPAIVPICAAKALWNGIWKSINLYPATPGGWPGPSSAVSYTHLLQEKGLIKLSEDAGLNATVNDIEENPHNFSFVELEAAQIPRILGEVSFAVINGNYALEAGLKVQEMCIRDRSYTQEGILPAGVYNDFAIPDGQTFLVDLDNGQYMVEIMSGSSYKSSVKSTVEGKSRCV